MKTIIENNKGSKTSEILSQYVDLLESENGDLNSNQVNGFYWCLMSGLPKNTSKARCDWQQGTTDLQFWLLIVIQMMKNRIWLQHKVVEGQNLGQKSVEIIGFWPL